jgi:DNA-directed RNA polymerase specialized sigma24 family protein
MAKSGSATIDELLKQSKVTNRLLAAQLRSQMSQMDLVKLLATTDLTAKEIAEVLDTTAPTVAVTLQRLRKKAAKRGNRNSVKE